MVSFVRVYKDFNAVKKPKPVPVNAIVLPVTS